MRSDLFCANQFSHSYKLMEDLIYQIKQGGNSGQIAEKRLYELLRKKFLQRGSTHRLSSEESYSAFNDAANEIINKIRYGNEVFEDSENVFKLFSGIFNNKCVDMHRKKTTKKNEPHRETVDITKAFPELSDESADFMKRLFAQEELNEIEKTMMQLKGENCREILSLHGQGYSPKEIAKQLNYRSAAVVSVKKGRCKKELLSIISQV